MDLELPYNLVATRLRMLYEHFTAVISFASMTPNDTPRNRVLLFNFLSMMVRAVFLAQLRILLSHLQ
jgi:hypothetical protein